jgi:hypothetical protein
MKKINTNDLNNDLELFLHRIINQHSKQELLALAKACNLPLSRKGDRKKAALVQILTDWLRSNIDY